jgi:hypothetical protein
MRSEISLHELLVVEALCSQPKRWWMAKELADALQPHALLPKSVAPRTVRAHLTRLAKYGFVDVADVHPGHRYRISDIAEMQCGEYFLRIRQAAEVFELGFRSLRETAEPVAVTAH